VADNAISYAVSADNAKGIGVGAWEPVQSAPHVESTSKLSIDDLPMASADSYFARNREPQPDIVEGLIGESKITVLGGDYGVGKSPLIADLVLHITNGLEWCGRNVEKRPVIHFDFETPATKYKSDSENGAKRLGCPLPDVPEMLQPFFQHDSIKEPTTERLLKALGSTENCLTLVLESLKKSPKAVVIFDPVELFAPIDKLKAKEIVAFYQQLRKLFGEYPHAGILGTFNLRKPDAKNPRKSNLLSNARGWLQEVSGVNEILTRSDIRLGIDFFDEEQTIRVINGIQRGEPFNAMLIQPAGDPESGFELCPPEKFKVNDVFTSKQVDYWGKLPPSFTFNEGLRAGVPRSSLSRMMHQAMSVALLRSEDGKWTKVVHRNGPPGKLEPLN
jgi:AAA domain